MNIALNNISKNFIDFQLQDINLTINKGDFFVILGPSGSGKTLILEMIAGLLKPDSGKITGVRPDKIGFIYQDYWLFPHLNVFQNIAYGLRIRKSDKNTIQETVKKISGQLDIKHLLKRKITHLSGGEKQRVAIARAMAISPDIYLFDEPTSSLDRNLRIKTRRMFLDLHKQTSSTFIHVTHDFEEALSLADKLAILLDGKIVQCSKPDEVFNFPRTKAVADFLGYRNVFGGRVKNSIFTASGVSISVPLKQADFAYIAVRSDEIILSKKKIKSSARNTFPGQVENIMKNASGVEVVVNAGLLFVVDITRQSYAEMDLKIGDKLWITFKVSSIKVFEH
jgi:molybdate/tungstate transport system ATP-binding protein